MITKQAAAADLMFELEAWAKSLGDFGVTKSNGARYFPSRQMHRTIRKAYAKGPDAFFHQLTAWAENYSYRADAYTERMKDLVRHGAPLWENIVAATGKTWSPYVSEERRRALHLVIARIHEDVASGDQLVAKMRAEWEARRAS
jgi:hypothetical protein